MAPALTGWGLTGTEMTPGKFEIFAGKAAAKKWKASIKVLGCLTPSGTLMELGKWLEVSCSPSSGLTIT